MDYIFTNFNRLSDYKSGKTQQGGRRKIRIDDSDSYFTDEIRSTISSQGMRRRRSNDRHRVRNRSKYRKEDSREARTSRSPERRVRFSRDRHSRSRAGQLNTRGEARETSPYADENQDYYSERFRRPATSVTQPLLDAVAAAYQAGRDDADASRVYGYESNYEYPSAPVNASSRYEVPRAPGRPVAEYDSTHSRAVERQQQDAKEYFASRRHTEPSTWIYPEHNDGSR